MEPSYVVLLPPSEIPFELELAGARANQPAKSPKPKMLHRVGVTVATSWSLHSSPFPALDHPVKRRIRPWLGRWFGGEVESEAANGMARGLLILDAFKSRRYADVL